MMMMTIQSPTAEISSSGDRDGTGPDFRDPTRPVTCLLSRPVTGRLTGEDCQFLTALDRPVDRQKLHHLDQTLPRQTRKKHQYTLQ